MKQLKKLARRLRNLFLVLILASAQVITATSPFIGTGKASATWNNDNKITICHRTASYSNPYNDISVDINAADGQAGNSGNAPDHYGEHQGPIFYPTIPQHTEWGDIIPPVSPYHTGLNWTAEGQLIWNNGCDSFAEGEIKVNKKVDTDGNNFYDGGNITANSIGFDWGLDGGSVNRNMGTDSGDIPVGNHTVTENSVSGYVFTGWYHTDDEDNSGSNQVNCTYPQGNTLPVTLEVKKNKTTKITLCNKFAPSSITIIKDAQPNHTQDFAFTTTGSGLSGFSLDDDAEPTLQNTRTFSNLAAGSYSVTESDTPGWTVAGIDCGQASGVSINGSTVNFNLAAGQNVSCTYTNTIQNGSLRVFKQVDEGEGYGAVGSNSPFKWGLDGGSVNRDMGTTQANLVPGNHSVTENSQIDYELVGWYIGEGSCTNAQNAKSLPVSVPVASNQITTLTFCNKVKEDRKVPLCHATGSEANPFVLINVSPAGAFNGHLGAGHQNGEDIIPPFQFNDQTYSQNWDTLGQIIFRGGCKRPADSRITGYKFHDLNGNSQKDGLFEPKIGGWTIYLFKVGNPNPVATTTTSNFFANYGNYSFSNLGAGDYKVCEAHPAGWAQIVPDPDTDDGCYLITLNGIDQATAVFGNQARATIKVIKNVDQNGDGDVDDAHERNNPNWSWNYLSLLDSDTGVTTGDSVEVRTGLTGTFYLLNEDQMPGYDLVDVDCNQHYWRVGDSVKVFATVGDEIECVFTNKKRAQVVIEKSADPSDGTDFDFSLSKVNPGDNEDAPDNDLLHDYIWQYGNWVHGDKTFTLDDADPDDDDEYTNQEVLSLKTGTTYYITEAEVEGWDLENIYCEGAQWYRNGNTLVLYVTDATAIHCWFHNEKKGEVKVTKFNDYDRDGKKDEDEPVLSGWDMTLQSINDCDILYRLLENGDNGQSCYDDYSYSRTQTTGDADAEGVTTFTGVKPYTAHNLSESLQDDWHWSNTYCQYDNEESEGAPSGENGYYLYASPGETVECFVGNYRDVILNLEKSNNSASINNIGDTITYTLTVSVPDNSGVSYNTTVIDLPPEGFTYIPGSATATQGSLTEAYGSPGTWSLGTILPGQIVILTYKVIIGNSVSAGIYPDVAFASGCGLPGTACPVEEVVYSNLSHANDPFVSTRVAVAIPQVLGASTSVLVNTGTPYMFAYITAAIALILAGVITTRRRNPTIGDTK